MSLLNKFFGQSESKFAHFENKLSQHEQIAANKLHTTHPNVRNIQAKHDIDLRNVRKHGTKIAAVGAILGMFLAIPHLFGHPATTNQPSPPPDSDPITKEIPKPDTNPPQAEVPPVTTPIQAPSLPNTQPPESGVGTPDQPHIVTPPIQPPVIQPPRQEDPSKSQGHQYGRSHLAPPKEHGFHDLGLHKGEVKNPQVPNVGPHPTELDVNKNQGGNV